FIRMSTPPPTSTLFPYTSLFRSYLVLAEEGAEDIAAHPEWLDRFEVEHENFRLAIDYLIKTGDTDWGLRIGAALFPFWETLEHLDRKSTRLNSSHVAISYAVFCL